MEPTVRLTDEQIAFFHRSGFLALPAITTGEEVERMKVIFDHLFASRAGREEGNEFDLGGTDDESKRPVLPQILSPAKYAPELKEGLFRVNALSIARQLLGDEASFGFEHAILKPAGYGAQTPWHQDEAYWSGEIDQKALSIWIPLQPATLDNGCLHFIPGSHEWDVIPHHTINHDPRIHGLEVDLEKVDLSSAVACPIPAGGCTIHPNRTLHYAGANRSEIPRRAYILNFRTPSVKAAAPRDFYWNRTRQAPRQARAQAAKEREKAPGGTGSATVS